MKRSQSNQLGSVSLEALLSMIIMFVAIYALWAVTVLIYNQSQVSTGSQFAAQTAVNTMVTINPYIHNPRSDEAEGPQNDSLRRGTGLCRYKNVYLRANCMAREQAEFVFKENTRDLLPNQFLNTAPTEVGQSSLRFSCVYRDQDNPYRLDYTEFRQGTPCRSNVSAIKADFISSDSLSSVSFTNFLSDRQDRNQSQRATASAIRLLVDGSSISGD